ncbi:MAG TPA: Do family serine endopeptidase [Geobacterales bacterium]|nr:Do family serine endopeptidase [Geobacterales bacterium]
MFGSPAKVKRSKHPKSLSLFAASIGILAAFAPSAFAGAGASELRNAATTPARAVEIAQTAALPSFSALVERIAPAVVSVHVKANPMAIAAHDEEGEDQQSEKDGPFDIAPSQRSGPKGFPPHTPFGHQPPSGPQARQDREKGADSVQPVQGQGSGFFISSDGYIVTNNHVVEGAIKVEVVRDDGDILEAKVVGTDPGMDLALLKVDGGGSFPAVALGHAEAKVGDWVIALGNPFGLEGTVTAGIVSALGRDIGMGAYDSFIQIDASVNRGNSGGPTFNQAGEVIGVNTAIFSPTGGSVGIAFAIPATMVENVVTQLREKGHVTRGWLGVQVQPVTPEIADGLGLKKARGALVSVPAPGGPADKAGIRRGDVILKINDGDVKDGRDMARRIASIAPSTRVKLTLFRDDKPKTVEVKVAELQDGENGMAPGRGLPQAEIGSLGLSVAPAMEGPDSPGGLAIVSVRPDGKAADAGLVRGDILLTANGTDLLSPDALEKALRTAKAAGKKHAIALVQRSGTQVYVALATDKS